MIKQITTMAVAILVLVLIGAGCGSDDGSSETGNAGSSTNASDTVSTSSLTKAEFIKKGEAICVRTRQRMLKGLGDYQAKIGEETLQPESKLVKEVKGSVLVPAIQSEIEEIGDLGAPAGEEQEVEAMLTALQQDLDTAEERPTASLDRFGGEFQEFDQLARKYGFQVCVFSS